MKLSTKLTKLEQALDHSQHHAQAKNMAANLREKHTVDHRIRPDDRFRLQVSKPMEMLEKDRIFARYNLGSRLS